MIVVVIYYSYICTLKHKIAADFNYYHNHPCCYAILNTEMWSNFTQSTVILNNIHGDNEFVKVQIEIKYCNEHESYEGIFSWLKCNWDKERLSFVDSNLLRRALHHEETHSR